MYDTFSPATQPQLWDVEIFRKIARNAAAGSILTTYCSKGTVKQALREAGFQLQRLSGPTGKRHILRATL
jgi:tRNA U34 5-methylaminomethyl-2-thiouridine-forming methyltransferase MnmC